MATGVRRRGRWFALQVLYALDMNGEQEPQEALATYAGDFELELDERSIGFGRELVMTTMTNLGAVDGVIQGVSRNWRLERMARVDRNILRLATCELLFMADVPVKVAINEAVELAKRYGTNESPAFVNGLLDRIAQRRAE